MMVTDNFFRAAKILGGSPEFVQGGGGNISEKQGEVMFVKASGYFLRDLKPREGYVGTHHHAIAEYLKKAARAPLTRRRHDLEQELNVILNDSLVPESTFGTPSMEAGMHAVLGKYVFHTHNTYANVLGCMQGGAQIIKKLFGKKALVVPYRNPGRELAVEITRAAKKRVPAIIFLLNHGLITHGDDFATALEAKRRVNAAIQGYLGAHRAYEPFRVERAAADFSKHLFPDSVVYSHVDFDSLPPEKREIFYEISSVVNYILASIKKLGGKPSFLDAKDVTFIANMDKEKYRMAMVKES